MCYEQIMKRHHYMQIVSAIFISLPSNVDARFWLNSVHLNSPSSRSRWWRRVRRFIVLHLINSSSRRRFCSCSSFAETSMTKTDICHQMQKVVAVHAHTHTRLTALCPGLPGWADTKPIWILLKQETVSGSGISWVVCKSAPHSRQTTTPAPHHSVFTGRMPFLPPNQQHHSTEGLKLVQYRERKTASLMPPTE